MQAVIAVLDKTKTLLVSDRIEHHLESLVDPSRRLPATSLRRPANSRNACRPPLDAKASLAAGKDVRVFFEALNLTDEPTLMYQAGNPNWTIYAVPSQRYGPENEPFDAHRRPHSEWAECEHVRLKQALTSGGRRNDPRPH